MPIWLPSACNSADKIPGSVLALTTTAPAPSPNNTQVPRSFQSRMLENTSAPITKAQRARPARIKASAVVSAYTKPLQTACTSKAADPLLPRLACTKQAVLGNTKSGVDVAKIIRSTSLASTCASTSARRAASVARVLVLTPRSAR